MLLNCKLIHLRKALFVFVFLGFLRTKDARPFAEIQGEIIHERLLWTWKRYTLQKAPATQPLVTFTQKDLLSFHIHQNTRLRQWR